LSAADCGVLVDKISSKIDFWLAKKLSFAWRLQLIIAVLYSILSFWWGFFVLPKKIVKILEQKFNRNLWSGSDSCKAKVKVAWELVCLPKTEGGLGLISGTRMVAYMQRMDIGWCINWIVRLMQTVFYEYVQKLVLAPS
jgi:hypothetical protein